MLIYLFQDKLIYYPFTQTQEQLIEQASLNHLELWPTNTSYRALISKSKNAKGTVLLFHGNAGSAIHRRHYVRALKKLEYNVIIAEYPGYGAREGIISEANLIKDARETAQLALQQFGKPLYLWGESLGAAVASAIVKENPAIVGIVLVTPFDKLPNVAQHHYWYIFGKWLSKARYDNVKNLQDFDGKVAVIMAEKDEIIPNSLTLNLYDNLKAQKSLWRFPEAGHNNLPLETDLPWWNEVMSFIAD